MDEAPPPPAPKYERKLSKAINWVLGATLIFWPLFVFMSLFASDAPGTPKSSVHLIYFAIWGYPAFVALSLVASWWLRRQYKEKAARWAAVFAPLFSITLLVIAGLWERAQRGEARAAHFASTGVNYVCGPTQVLKRIDDPGSNRFNTIVHYASDEDGGFAKGKYRKFMLAQIFGDKLLRSAPNQVLHDKSRFAKFSDTEYEKFFSSCRISSGQSLLDSYHYTSYRYACKDNTELSVSSWGTVYWLTDMSPENQARLQQQGVVYFGKIENAAFHFVYNANHPLPPEDSEEKRLEILNSCTDHKGLTLTDYFTRAPSKVIHKRR
jgi:hypothetical protein